MLKAIMVAGMLGLFAAAPAAAAPAQALPAGASATGINMVEQVQARHRDRRDMRHHNRGQRWVPGQRYRSSPPGWRRYGARPGDWRTRGCVMVGPVWFCP